MIAALYARVSTDKQDDLNQMPVLEAMAKNYGCIVAGEYHDVASGRSPASERPGFAQLMKDAEKKNFDTIIVVKLDRVMRSLKQLLDLLEKLEKLNIRLIAGDLGLLDFASPIGKLHIAIVGAIAEWEAGVISERTRAALAAKKARGVKLGRPPVTRFDLETAAKLKLSGHTRQQIADKLGCKVYELNNYRNEIKEICAAYTKDLNPPVDEVIDAVIDELD